MQRLHTFIAALLCTAMSLPAALSGQSSPVEIAEKFFSDYDQSGISVALDNLYTSNIWMQRATDAVSNLKSQMEGLTEDYIGKYYGYELIASKKISESYVLLSYMVRFDRQPLRFNFHFYKPDRQWRIHLFQYDGDLDDEIEETVKLYYLDLLGRN